MRIGVASARHYVNVAFKPERCSSNCLRYGFKAHSQRKVVESQRKVDATRHGMLISPFILCVAPSAGLVTIRSLIPVSRGIVPASAVVENVLNASIALRPTRKSNDRICG